jgi:hypothetical protein
MEQLLNDLILNTLEIIEIYTNIIEIREQEKEIREEISLIVVTTPKKFSQSELLIKNGS